MDRNHIGTFNLDTRAQAAIFSHELLGQFSDGHWENVSGDWESLNSAEVICDPTLPLGAKGFRPRTAYGCSSKELREVVGDRMMLYAKLAIAFPEVSIEDIGTLEHYEGYKASMSDDYWTKSAILAAKLLGCLPVYLKVNVQTRLDAVVYTEDMLIKDLRKISRILAASVKGKSITREELNGKQKRKAKSPSTFVMRNTPTVQVVVNGQNFTVTQDAVKELYKILGADTK
jgi:hypothetical protein